MQRNRDYRLLIWTLSGLSLNAIWLEIASFERVHTPRFLIDSRVPLHEVNRGYIGHYVQNGIFEALSQKMHCASFFSIYFWRFESWVLFSLYIFTGTAPFFLPFLMVNKGALIPITKTWICDLIRKRWTAEIYWYVGIGECGVRGWALMPHANALALFLFYFCVFLPPLSANAFSKKCISTHKKK